MKQVLSLWRQTHDALKLFGLQIRERRIARKMTVNELAERVGVSRGLIQRIESGAPGTSLGVAFETARIVDMELFEPQPTTMAERVKRATHILTLMPQTVRHRREQPDDDF